MAKTYTVVVERCPDTGLYVGYVPGFPGAQSQAATLDELNKNLREVVELFSRDTSPILLRKIAEDIGLTIDQFLNP